MQVAPKQLGLCPAGQLESWLNNSPCSDASGTKAAESLSCWTARKLAEQTAHALMQVAPKQLGLCPAEFEKALVVFSYCQCSATWLR